VEHGNPLGKTRRAKKLEAPRFFPAEHLLNQPDIKGAVLDNPKADGFHHGCSPRGGRVFLFCAMEKYSNTARRVCWKKDPPKSRLFMPRHDNPASAIRKPGFYRKTSFIRTARQ
jgi:hypothetical protein